MDTDNRWVLNDHSYSLLYISMPGKKSRRLNNQNGIPHAFSKYTSKYYHVSKHAIQTLATYLMAQGHLCYHQEAFNAG